MAHYRAVPDAAMADIQERMLTNANIAQAILQERLEETPEDISTQTLIEITKANADRTGHGVRTTNVNVNVNLASRLENARRRAESGPRLIPADSCETPPDGAEVRPTLDLRANPKEPVS
jgi:hypothetical protein